MDREFNYVLIMAIFIIFSGFVNGFFILGGSRTESIIFSFGTIFTIFFAVIFYILYIILTKGFKIK